jgi:hypothetical protein
LKDLIPPALADAIEKARLKAAEKEEEIKNKYEKLRNRQFVEAVIPAVTGAGAGGGIGGGQKIGGGAAFVGLKEMWKRMAGNASPLVRLTEKTNQKLEEIKVVLQNPATPTTYTMNTYVE